MSKRETLIGLLLVVLITGAAYTIFSGSNKAPSTTVTDIDSNIIEIPSSTKYSLITFWATSCVSCRAEVPHLIDLQSKYGSDTLNITAVAMSYDPEEQVHTFRQLRGLNYPIVLDSTGALAELFGNVALTPTTFLIDRTGTIVYKKVGEFDNEHLQQILNGG